MTDYSRNFQFALPEGPDSMAASAGLTAFNTWVDAVDTRLAEVAAMGADPALFLGVWAANAAPNLSSSATISNITYALTNPINIAGTGTVTVNITNGDIGFDTEGFYRLTINNTVVNNGAYTEGQVSFGLKPTGVASYISRCSFNHALETEAWATMVNKSFIFRAATAGGDVDLTTTYKIGIQQTNSSGGTVVMGDGPGTTASWFAFEYLRPLT